MKVASLFYVFSFVASRVSARRPSCASLFDVFSCEAGRVSPRQASSFLLLRQKKGTKEKASRRQGRCAVPCAARCQRGRAQTRFAQTGARPDPLSPALLSPVSTAGNTNSQAQHQYQLRSLAFGIANSLQPAHAFDASPGERAQEGEAVPAFAIEAVPSSAAAGGSGLALFERSEFSQTPPDASSAGNREAARTLARLSFGYFSLAKQRKVARLPGRNPACHDKKNPTKKANTAFARKAPPKC